METKWSCGLTFSSDWRTQMIIIIIVWFIDRSIDCFGKVLTQMDLNEEKKRKKKREVHETGKQRERERKRK